MPEPSAPVTREELHQELAIIEARILNAVRQANEDLETRFLNAVRQANGDLETRFLNAVRQANEDLETRLLTAFHSYARGVEAKIRVSQTIGLAGVERLDALEARVLDIEQKLLHR
jgi:uncharacterized protein YajQ (UPF0234 family)